MDEIAEDYRLEYRPSRRSTPTGGAMWVSDADAWAVVKPDGTVESTHITQVDAVRRRRHLTEGTAQYQPGTVPLILTPIQGVSMNEIKEVLYAAADRLTDSGEHPARTASASDSANELGGVAHGLKDFVEEALVVLHSAGDMLESLTEQIAVAEQEAQTELDQIAHLLDESNQSASDEALGLLQGAVSTLTDAKASAHGLFFKFESATNALQSAMDSLEEAEAIPASIQELLDQATGQLTQAGTHTRETADGM